MKKIQYCFVLIFCFLIIACSKTATPPAPSKTTAPTSPRIVLNALEVEKIKSNLDKHATVHGKVYNVFEATSGKVINLNMGTNYKSCFKAVIFASSFNKWPREREFFNSLIGKDITVEGSIQDYKGAPQIIISSPVQLKIE